MLLSNRKRGKENTIARDYVLPDYTHIKRGYVRPLEETTGKAKDGEQVGGRGQIIFYSKRKLFYSVFSDVDNSCILDLDNSVFSDVDNSLFSNLDYSVFCDLENSVFLT